MSRQRTSAGTWLVFVLLIFVFYTWSQVDESIPSRSTAPSPSTAASPGGAPQRTGPSWTSYTSKDDLTDEVIHYAHFKAAEGRIYDIQAWARCKTSEKEFDIIFEVGDFIGSGDYDTGGIKVEYRFDGNAVKTTDFIASTTGKNIFVRRSDIPEFVFGMTKGNRLRLRVYDYTDTPHDADIPLRGSSTTISKVYDACL